MYIVLVSQVIVYFRFIYFWSKIQTQLLFPTDPQRSFMNEFLISLTVSKQIKIDFVCLPLAVATLLQQYKPR